MKVTIVCVGKIKEKYLKDAIDEYSKRLSRYINLQILEVADEKTEDNISPAQEENIRIKESERILKKLAFKKGDYIISLALDGKEFTSEAFSDMLQQNMTMGIPHIYFIIGGSLGISKHLLAKSNAKICFSKMTFPHQLMRVILLEQVYRSFKIINNEPYHK